MGTDADIDAGVGATLADAPINPAPINPGQGQALPLQIGGILSQSQAVGIRARGRLGSDIKVDVDRQQQVEPDA